MNELLATIASNAGLEPYEIATAYRSSASEERQNALAYSETATDHMVRAIDRGLSAHAAQKFAMHMIAVQLSDAYRTLKRSERTEVLRSIGTAHGVRI